MNTVLLLITGYSFIININMPIIVADTRTTPSPTYCFDSTYRYAKSITFESDKENILLNIGESIISKNCKYLFILELDGNLFLYDVSKKLISRTNKYSKYKTIWQTNILQISNNTNIKFKFDINNVFIVQNGTILWNENIAIDPTENDNIYLSLQVNDDATVYLHDGYNVIWNLNDITTTIFYDITTNEPTRYNGNINNDDNDDDFHNSAKIIVILAVSGLCICFTLYLSIQCFCFMQKQSRKQKQQNLEMTVNYNYNKNQKNIGIHKSETNVVAQDWNDWMNESDSSN